MLDSSAPPAGGVGPTLLETKLIGDKYCSGTMPEPRKIIYFRNNISLIARDYCDKLGVMVFVYSFEAPCHAKLYAKHDERRRTRTFIFTHKNGLPHY